MAHTLPDLPYSADALEPHIDATTMTIHHDKHHGGYVAKLNAALEGHDELAAKSLDDLLRGLDEVPGGHPGSRQEQWWWSLESHSLLDQHVPGLYEGTFGRSCCSHRFIIRLT